MCTFLYFRFGKHACLEDWFFKHCTISLFLVLTLILKFLRWLNVDDSCWHIAINIKSMLVCANYVHMCAFVLFFFVLLFALSLVSFLSCTGTIWCAFVPHHSYILFILFHLHLLGSFFQFLPSLSVLVFFVYTCICMFFLCKLKAIVPFQRSSYESYWIKKHTNTAQHSMIMV